MRIRPGVPALALACLLATAAPATAETVPCPGADTAVTPSNRDASRLTLVCLVDRERASRGLPRLAADARVAASAQGHAQDMADRGYFSHTAPPPKPATAPERLRAQGYDPASHGEVLGDGHATPRAVIRAWMQSTVHCQNLLAAAGPDYPSLGPAHIGVGQTGTGSGSLWVLQVALPVGGQDPGYPGFTPACPAAGPAPDSAEVRPFVRHPQNGEPASAPGPGQAVAPAPTGASSAGLTPPVLASPSGTLFSGDEPELTVEASPDAVLQVSLRNFRGERRQLGAARRIEGVAGSHPGTAVFALPRFRVHSAVEVLVTDGRTAVSRRLVPAAVLRRVRARRTVTGLRVSGVLRPALAGRVVQVTLTRGARRVRQTVRTLRGGRFAATLRPPPGTGRLTARVVVPGQGQPYRRATAIVRGR